MKNKKLAYYAIIIVSILIVVLLPIPVWLKPVEKWVDEPIFLPLFMILLESLKGHMGFYNFLWLVPLFIAGLDFTLIRKMQKKDSI